MEDTAVKLSTELQAPHLTPTTSVTPAELVFLRKMKYQATWDGTTTQRWSYSVQRCISKENDERLRWPVRQSWICNIQNRWLGAREPT